MHVEITRMLTGWLAHPEYGVNKLVLTMPRANLKGVNDDKPDKVDIYNDVDFDIGSVAGIDPPSFPSVVVVADLDLKNTDAGQVHKSAYEIAAVAGIGYYAEEITKARNIRDGNYVLRSVMRSLRRFNKPSLSTDYRQLNGVGIVRITNLTMQRVAGAVPTSRLLGVVFADLMVLDKAP